MNIDKSDGLNGRSTTHTDTISGRSPELAGGQRSRPAAVAPGGGEPLTLSPALQAILESSRSSVQSEVDQGRVESIRQAIADGTYHVDPNRLAEQFLGLESLIDQ